MSDSPPKKAKIPRYVRTVVTLPDQKEIAVYAGKKVRDALTEISKEMTIYHGVRLTEVLEAVYTQGKKDGARAVFDTVDGLKRTISHRNPGQPRKKRKPTDQKC